MNNLVKVSVVVPNYNHEKYLRSRISSILNQSFSDFEFIILDDNSSDQSMDIIDYYIQQDTRISFNKSKKNSGNTFVQWNKGVFLANSEFVWIAESDDEADPDLLDTLLRPLLNDADIVLSYCQSFRMNEESEVTGSWGDYTEDLHQSIFHKDFIMDGSTFIDKYLIHRNVIPNASAVVFRKSVYDKIGGADESLKTNSDWLTWIKMLYHGKVAFNSRHLNYFRYHSNSVIAKANQESNILEYKCQFDYNMRLKFDNYIAVNGIKISNRIKKSNRSYIQSEEGNNGLFLLERGQYIKGFALILKASFWPVFQTGFIKRAIKML